MQSRHRFALVPVAIGLAALLAQGHARAQEYNPGMPLASARPGPGDANVLGNPEAMAADPSSRIATVTDKAGGLSFAPAGSDDWAAIGLNRPVTTGDRLWVDPGGRAELHAGSTAVRLGGGTAASILNLDDHTTQVKLTQGTLQLRVRALPQDQQVEVDTPNLAFVPREPGDYRLDVSPDGTTTMVTMRHGSAVLYGDTRSIEMSRGQRMRFAGTDLADAGPGNYPVSDSFDRWTAARDGREDGSVSARYVPPDMTGYTALDDYGDWQEDPGYGAVWFPREVATDWAPYSTGHWAWVAPWGWTWIDDEPWGFAPSHYGRWAYFGSRWGWVPGPIAVRPCYVPAVVGFIGGVTATISIGGGPGVAWYPLGPRDVYRPVYRASPTYITRINTINNITVNNNTWIRGGDHDRWINRNVPGAISGMPSRNFVEGRPVPRGSSREEWRHLPVGEGRGAPSIAPVKTSLIGGARPQGLPQMARDGFERQAIAAHPPGRVGPDELARRFAREGGTAGAGPAWRGPVPVPDTRQAGQRRGPQPAQAMPWQPDVRMSQAAQAAQAGRGPAQRADQMRGVPQEAQRQQALQRQQFDQQRVTQEQQRQQVEQQRQQATQRQQFDQQRMTQEQQRQQVEQQRQQATQRQQFDQQRQTQEQQRQQADQQRQQATQRQQFDQQRQAQEQQRQQMEQQRQQATQRQQFEQQRQAQEQQRQQMEQQRQQATQRQQFEQQRQAQEQQRQQMEQQRQQAMQRQQFEQQRQAQEQQRQQMEQQRQQAMQRQQFEQQRQAQEQQRQQMEQQRQQVQQRQQMEQQRQMQEQQHQQQERQRQIQQQQQQQRVQQEHARQMQAHNDDRR